jgi:hypothetical protein
MFKKSPDKLLLEAEKLEAQVDQHLRLAGEGGSLSVRQSNLLSGMRALAECFGTLKKIDPSDRPRDWEDRLQRLDRKHDELERLQL